MPYHPTPRCFRGSMGGLASGGLASGGLASGACIIMLGPLLNCLPDPLSDHVSDHELRCTVPVSYIHPSGFMGAQSFQTANS
jgi:hypothetical protein